MRRFLYSVLLITLVTLSLVAPSCQKEEVEKKQWPTPHTLMFYFVGTDLRSFFENNITLTKRALCELSSSNGELSNAFTRPRVIYFHQKDGQRDEAEIVELVYAAGQCTEKTWATYQLPDIVSKEDMSRYIQEMMRFAPAESYGLVVGAHSRGWVPIDAPDFEATASTERKKMVSDYWKKAPNALPTRFLGEGYPFFYSYSEGHANMFDIEDVAEAISSTGVKLEYTIYDACFMANIETLYDLRHTSKYIVASVCEIMGEGFPYDDVVPHLLAYSGSRFNLDGVCQAFHNHYAEKVGFSGSISLIDCSELEALAAVTKEVIATQSSDTALPDIDEENKGVPALQYYEGLNPHLYYDFGQYINQLCKNESQRQIFNTQLGRTVVSKYTLNRFYSGLGWGGYHRIDTNYYSGLSTSLPSTKYRTEYTQTEWYKATHFE